MLGSGAPPIDNTLKIQNKGKYGDIIEITSDIDPGLPKAKQYCASLRFEWLIEEGCKSVNSLPGFGNITLETDDPFASIPINIDLTGTCYQIEGIMNNGVPTQFTPPVQVLLSSVPVGRAPNCNSVVVFISRVKYKFKLTTYLNNRKDGEIGYKREINPIDNLKDVIVKIYHKCGERRELIGYSGYAKQQDSSVMIYDIRRGTEVTYIELPCGEEIELEAVKDIREEGFNFSHWSYGTPMTKYVRPSPPEIPTFSFVLDRDKSAIAIFREEFRLRKIGFYQNNAIPWSGGDVSWLTTKEIRLANLAGEMPEDINIYLTAIEMNSYAPVGEIPNVQTNWVRYGTEIKYQFNEPVNKSSISETNWWRLYCMDESLRYDIGYSGSQKVIYTPKSQYLTWSNEDKRVTQKLLTTESNPRIGNGAEYGISYMEKFRIRTEGITNLNGEHIWNPGTYYAETEMPGVNLFLHSVRPTATSGDGPLETYTLYDAGIRDVVGGSSNALGGKVPNWCYDEIKAGSKLVYNKKMISKDKLSRTDLVTADISSFDFDGTDDFCSDTSLQIRIWKNYFNGFEKLWDKLSNPEVDDITKKKIKDGDKDTSVAIIVLYAIAVIFYAVIGFIVSFIAWALSWLYHLTDPLGTNNFIFSKADWFGANPSLINRSNNNIVEHEVKTLLKVNQIP
jgi:hypothetical protein